MTTILLVEDKELNRDKLGRCQIRRGFAVLSAANGLEAVTAGDCDRALEAGCAYLHTKPIDLPWLLGKIERLLERGERHDA